MMRVAVLGGGPAGAYAAELLSRGGFRTMLFDEKLAWEKPCGGGLTYKAYRAYPFLADSPSPKRWVHKIGFTAGGGQCTLDLDRPLLLYSRRDLNQILLCRAERAGVEIEKARVVGLDRSASGWRIRTGSGTADADACVVATGARNGLREAGMRFGRDDAMMALGYYIDAEQSHIDLAFERGLEGYLWVFPRCGHVSVGICGKRESAASLRARLEKYMEERGWSPRNGRFYAHLLPSLEAGSWRRNRLGGPRWLAIGDAAGLVDPITGEGIYYAIRSGDLAARALLEHGPDAASAYRSAVERDFTSDLALGAAIAPRFYRGSFLRGPVTTRMIQFTRRSPRFASLMRELFSGTQGYGGLRRRLWRSLAPTLLEIAVRPS
jgi:geranylgeranyl reductase family protein